MTEKENLQNESSKESKRGRKSRTFDDPFVTEEKVEKKAWIVEPEQKKCPVCGAEMKGWACRQNFVFCPMCGEKLG